MSEAFKCDKCGVLMENETSVKFRPLFDDLDEKKAVVNLKMTHDLGYIINVHLCIDCLFRTIADARKLK